MARNLAMPVCVAAVFVFAASDANALSMKSAGTGVAIALPLVAGGITLMHDWDWHGAAELALDTGLTVGTALALKQFVREQRPDHSDFKSFPSDTAALAFAPSAYLWDRYGWEYGAPAYAAAAFVGYSRVDTKEHHWWDVLASAGIAWTYSQFITTRYQRRYGIYSELEASPQGAFVTVNYRF